MTEPFRQSGLSCATPACKGASLREHDGHLVCDHCHSILISLEAYAASLTELDGANYAVEARDGTPEAARCPRCGDPMRMFTLQRGPHLMRGRYLGCARHGLWMPREGMTASYARAGQAGRVAGARRAPSSLMNLAATGGAAAAMRGVRDAFSRNQRSLASYDIPRPRVHTAFVSAHRGQALRCPACAPGTPLGFEGDRWVCKVCAGAFVEDAAIVAMVTDILNRPWELAEPAGPPGERKCPVCAGTMVVEHFEGVTIDRCRGHGLWFDDRELAAALLHVGDPPSTTRGWLKRLFHREP